MADFNLAFIHTMEAEGDYVNDPDDSGGETYMGVARTKNPHWPGWPIIDDLKNRNDFPECLDNDEQVQLHVKSIYAERYWDVIKGNDIEDQKIAESIFDFAVNAGPGTSAKLAQIAVGAIADGIIGRNSLAKINGTDKSVFMSEFTLAKIQRYVEICDGNSNNRKFFYGWIKRALNGL